MLLETLHRKLADQIEEGVQIVTPHQLQVQKLGLLELDELEKSLDHSLRQFLFLLGG